MSEITVFLIVKNEERLLPRCLDSVTGMAGRILVVDTGSTDRTVELAREFGRQQDVPPLQLHQIPFRDFGSTRQAALDLVETAWAFWIDADELITPELCERIGSLHREGKLEHHGAWSVRRVNRVLGRRMRARNLAHDHVLRLFRPELARITPTAVHEGLELAPGTTVGRLDEPLLHDTMVDLRSYLAKIDHYTTLDAARSERGFSLWHWLTGPPATFLRHYVGRGGFRDGRPGLVWAAASAWSNWLRDYKLLRRSRARDS